MDIIQALTQELQVEKWQIEAAVKLIDEGNTIPFISRYRKEATDGRTEKIDSGGTDSRSCRRSVPPVPPEAKNQSNDCQRERAGTSGQSDPASDDRQVHRRRSGKLCI